MERKGYDFVFVLFVFFSYCHVLFDILDKMAIYVPTKVPIVQPSDWGEYILFF